MVTIKTMMIIAKTAKILTITRPTAAKMLMITRTTIKIATMTKTIRAIIPIVIKNITNK